VDKNDCALFQVHLEQTLEQLKKGEVKGKIRRSGASKTSERKKRVQFAVEPTEASLQNIIPIEVRVMLERLVTSGKTREMASSKAAFQQKYC